jgi:putative sterol carrier protein
LLKALGSKALENAIARAWLDEGAWAPKGANGSTIVRRCHGEGAFATHFALELTLRMPSPSPHHSLNIKTCLAHHLSLSALREEIMDLATITAGMKERVEAKPAFGNTVKFDFGDDGRIHIDGKNGNTVTNDDGPADCTLKVAFTDFVDMVEGRLNGMNAFMSGKLKVEGDMSIAMKLQTIIG